jgi:hypothetical protein
MHSLNIIYSLGQVGHILFTKNQSVIQVNKDRNQIIHSSLVHITWMKSDYAYDVLFVVTYNAFYLIVLAS